MPVHRETSLEAAHQPIAYQRAPRVVRVDLLEGSMLRNLWLPAVLLLLGCGAVYIRLRYQLLLRADAWQAWRWTGFMLTWNIGIMLAGACLLARVLAVAFGPLWTALAKLAAIAVGPYALVLVVQYALGGGAAGVFVGMLLAIPFGCWLFMYLFAFDAQEAFICYFITLAMRWMSYLIYWICFDGWLLF